MDKTAIPTDSAAQNEVRCASECVEEQGEAEKRKMKMCAAKGLEVSNTKGHNTRRMHEPPYDFDALVQTGKHRKVVNLRGTDLSSDPTRAAKGIPSKFSAYISAANSERDRSKIALRLASENDNCSLLTVAMYVLIRIHPATGIEATCISG